LERRHLITGGNESLAKVVELWRGDVALDASHAVLAGEIRDLLG
jgi:hypothetical protein